MRYTVLTLGALFTVVLASPASAYCCWNKAICQAVCGSDCCGNDLQLSTPVDPRALGQFEIQVLTSDLQNAENVRSSSAEERRSASEFARLLREEIQRRGGTPPPTRQ